MKQYHRNFIRQRRHATDTAAGGVEHRHKIAQHATFVHQGPTCDEPPIIV